MLAYWSFKWNLWLKGSVGVDSNRACISSGKDGMVLEEWEKKHFKEDKKVH